MTHKFDGRSAAMGKRGMMIRNRLKVLRDPAAARALFDGRKPEGYPERKGG